MQFYNQKETWANYTKLDELNEKRVKETISLIPEDVHSILEVGCGSGVIINRLPSFDQVVGLDLSLTAIRYVSQNKVLGNCNYLPFRGRTFEVIIAAELLEHLDLKTLEETVMELERVSKQYILISIPYREKTYETFVKCASCGNAYSPYDHQQYFDEHIVKELIRSKNYKIEFCGTKKRLLTIKKIMQIFGIYSYRENSVCPRCGSKKLKYGKIEKIVNFAAGLLTKIIAKPEPNWILCLYQLEEKAK